MRHLPSPLIAFLVLMACGKKEPTPSPAPISSPPASAQPDTAPSAPPDTAPSAPPDAAQSAPPDAAPSAPADASAPADESSYLVWLPTGEGYETAWIAPDEAGGFKVIGRRAQATLFADGTLWGIEARYVPYREVDCWAYEAEEEGGPKARSGPKKHVPWLAARGLAGLKAGEERELARKVSAYLFGEQPKDGVYTLIGEHWGRTVQLVGGAADALLVMDCEGAYGCGAHGEWGCNFGALRFDGAAVPMDLDAAARALAAETQEMIAAWAKEAEGEAIGPDVRAVSLRANGGEPVIEYMYVADVAYSSTSGDWGSYTQSRKHVGKPVPALGLTETPALVKAFLANEPKEASFGWSLVPKDAAESMLAAFRDAETLPAPKPADETPEQLADANAAQAKVNEGRKLTRDKQYAEAIAAFDEALRRSGDKLARAWSGRGYAKLLAGDEAGARSDFERALALDDDAKFQAAIYFNLGELAEGQKDKAKAIEAYRKALALNPTDAAKKRLEKLGAP